MKKKIDIRAPALLGEDPKDLLVRVQIMIEARRLGLVPEPTQDSPPGGLSDGPLSLEQKWRLLGRRWLATVHPCQCKPPDRAPDVGSGCRAGRVEGEAFACQYFF